MEVGKKYVNKNTLSVVECVYKSSDNSLSRLAVFRDIDGFESSAHISYWDQWKEYIEPIKRTLYIHLNTSQGVSTITYSHYQAESDPCLILIGKIELSYDEARRLFEVKKL